MKHIGVRRIIGLAFGEATTADEKEHLGLCKRCSEKTGRLFDAADKAVSHVEKSGQMGCDANQAALYVDGVMHEKDLARFEKHLFVCKECLRSVWNLMEDMYAFGLLPRKKNIDPVDAVVRIARKGLELIGSMSKSDNSDPVLEFAAETRGLPKRSRVIRMIWHRIVGKSRLRVILTQGLGLRVGLSVVIVSSREKSLKLDFMRDEKLVESRLLIIGSEKESVDLGSLGRGHYRLLLQGVSFFSFSVAP